ncbi:MAG: hypothetical protein WEC15_01900 [Flavobacteriales bacterium]
MIRRSFLVFVVLAVGYGLFLRFVQVDWDTTQHLANGNRIKAERFVYGADVPDATVIVGSSLAYRIVLDSMPDGTTNLGFGGLSIYDGLTLVERSGKAPARVLIETNVLFREPDHGFLKALFEPGLYEVRREVPMMQEENQPSGVLFGWLKQRLLNERGTDDGADSTAVPNAVMMDEHRTNYALLPADSTNQRFLAMLERDVLSLEARGVEVIFFEVPIEPELMNSTLAVKSRSLIEARFPGRSFIRSNERWRTTDGLHLDKRDAQRFSGWLAASLRNS